MICKVRKTIEKYNLLNGAKSLAVGVSGGADSMCLLEILSKLKQEYDIILKVVHVNHNIRGEEALRDQRAVEDFCRKLGIECLVYSVDIPVLAKEMGLGEEECGRIKRYECYEKACCDVVATAHSLSDSIETMMFNLIRGTGVKGLCGIPARRDYIIRPLIECTRSEIEEYCRENEIPYVTDSTNLGDDYTRNFIRHNIVAEFSQVNQNYESAIASAMETLRTENDAIERMKETVIKSAETSEGYKTSDLIVVDAAVRRRAIAEMLSIYMKKDVEKRHIDLVDAIVLKGEGKVEISKDLYVIVCDGLILFKYLKRAIPEWEAEYIHGKFTTPVGTFYLEETSCEEYKNINAIDVSKIEGKLHMSSRKESDRFYSHVRGVTKTLKKLFNEMKIPAENRNDIAILRDDKNLIWIEGVGTDGKYIPDINSTDILIIRKEC